MKLKIIRNFCIWLARATFLLGFIEWVRYVKEANRADIVNENKEFEMDHPDFPLPPPELAYDAYGSVNWEYYFRSGKETAAKVASIIHRHKPGKGIKVFEWGCGPGCVIRHLPELLESGNEIYGSDYNKETITWCKKAINGISFVNNKLKPPLPFDEDKFDCIYALSVFTHLSLENCNNWMGELSRICKPEGIIIFTTKGMSQAERLLPHERKLLQNGLSVVRGNVTEGKRIFDTIHTPEYVKNVLLKDLKLLEFIPDGMASYKQDLWIAKRPSIK
jgi:SAM-dependent methyltransferase